MSNESKPGWKHSPRISRSLIASSVLVFIAVSIAAIWWVPGFFVDAAAGKVSALSLTSAERVTAVTNARQGVLFMVGGVIAVFTLLITLAKHNLDRRGQDLDREKQELDRDANRTTRYTEAIKQLGDETSFAVRLGGIYALERIAQDSDRDRQTILAVLWSYLRAESPVKQQSGDDVVGMKSDVAAAATAAGRITQLSRPTNHMVLPGVNLNGVILTDAYLAFADLKYANLINADLEDAVLDDAELNNADLTNANFLGATFVGADLSGVKLTDGFLSGANLHRAKIVGADLTDTNLHSADVSGADLTEVNLTRVNLTSANLTATDLTNANLTDVNLSAAHLVRAILTDASLTGADLTNANFSGANLTNADLSRANLSNADFSEVNLTNADLSGVNLANTNLSGARASNIRGALVPVSRKYLQERGAIGLNTVLGLPGSRKIAAR